eukprot:COSAG02_NODE_9611_length_2161_cov_2.452473_1_plen_137_part_00
MAVTGQQATAAEAAAAADVLRAIIARPAPGQEVIIDPERLSEEFDEFERFVADFAVDCGLQTEPQPEPAREPEPEPAPARRRRRGRYRAHTDKLGNPEAETQEPITCFSPERRFEAKERRERPPRRYDKVESEMKV